MQPLKDLLTAQFRSNPAYELVAFDQLSADHQWALADFAADGESYGVLWPRGDSNLSVKSVCQNTASLFRALKTPGSLPPFVSAPTDLPVNAQIAGLVLDGILQIQREDQFLCGASALNLVYVNPHRIENAGRLAQISRAALRFGQQLAFDDPVRLSVQLYFFNRAPVTPRWQRLLPDVTATGRFLGIQSGPLARSLRADWKEAPLRPDALGWRRWSLRGLKKAGPHPAYDYKIYVSPALAAVPDALPTIVEVFAERGVRQFKIGADVAGLSRADKIVAYLDSFDEVDEVSRVLDERLAEMPVQGVPFTADLRRDGLISWGMDPHRLPAIEGRERRSWRLWVTDRLATALVQARQADNSSVEPWQFAEQRLTLDGIDTDTWTPLPEFQRTLEAAGANA